MRRGRNSRTRRSAGRGGGVADIRPSRPRCGGSGGGPGCPAVGAATGSWALSTEKQDVAEQGPGAPVRAEGDLRVRDLVRGAPPAELQGRPNDPLQLLRVDPGMTERHGPTVRRDGQPGTWRAG